VDALVRSVLSLVVGAALHAPLLAAPAAPAEGTWLWPVRGPVIEAFDPPETPFGSGHRGIDIAVSFGTTVVAPDAATVAFAGKVGGHLFVTLDHGAGLTSTYSWVSAALVRRNDVVAAGAPIALSGQGHPGSTIPHLHFGVRLDGVYLDPLDFLGPADVSAFIRLAPL
jgi:murein DD-endopeptidase MepM/ murein hydrolase activator NlpD